MAAFTKRLSSILPRSAIAPTAVRTAARPKAGAAAIRPISTSPVSSSTTFSKGHKASRSSVIHDRSLSALTTVIIGSTLLLVLGEDLAARKTVKAEEASTGPIFKKEDCEVICVIGPPLSGKLTQTQRIAKRFDALPLGPEDDYFTEITTHLLPNRGHRLRIVINSWPGSLAEAQWFEEEICPIAAIVYIDTPVNAAMARTSKRAHSAVRSGHRLFQMEAADLIKEFRKRGNFLEITGENSLEECWEQIEAKVDQALQLSARGELI